MKRTLLGKYAPLAVALAVPLARFLLTLRPLGAANSPVTPHADGTVVDTY